ncbi:sulfate ABC transporter, inner membrane subunit CysT [Corchorus capsularis]|uniref:Sulfate ABC transporter, inner membrane subunit CysT n=1 Tax=Corchorus capsularis TaxID=210143 RepID=A0A1R3H0L3_COCAP|nr:sulfate ABC transporter, inner membrane subunit CysT [Corchorus capsularis]
MMQSSPSASLVHSSQVESSSSKFPVTLSRYETNFDGALAEGLLGGLAGTPVSSIIPLLGLKSDLRFLYFFLARRRASSLKSVPVGYPQWCSP